jgi:hypothetical protein
MRNEQLKDIEGETLLGSKEKRQLKNSMTRHIGEEFRSEGV